MGNFPPNGNLNSRLKVVESDVIESKNRVIPASRIQLGLGTPSLTVKYSNGILVPYWSMSGLTSGQSLCFYCEKFDSDYDGLQVIVHRVGLGSPLSSEYEVFNISVSEMNELGLIHTNIKTYTNTILKSLVDVTFKTEVLESFVRHDIKKPLLFRLNRDIADTSDNYQTSSGIVAIELRPIKLSTPITVVNPNAYQSWPFIFGINNKLVCVFSKGLQHDQADLTRVILKTESLDGGNTWSTPVEIINRVNKDDIVKGKGYDSNGNALIWTFSEERHYLYKTTDGDTFTLISSPIFAHIPIQITDIFSVPTVGLMAFYMCGDYDVGLSNKSWGIVTSSDNGVTWTQTEIESGCSIDQWPTEIAGVYTSNGKIFAIGRNESTDGTTIQAMFQITSSNYGSTWSKVKTNITDIRVSTPTLIYDSNIDTVYLYYYHRVLGILKTRKAVVNTIWSKPKEWEASTALALGSTSGPDAGNVNSVLYGDKHALVYFSGDSTDTGIYTLLNQI